MSQAAPGAAGTPAPNPVLQYYQQWSEKNALVTRGLMIVIVASFILSFFVGLENYLGNRTFFTIFHFEVYRLFLSPFVGDSLLSLIIVIMMFPAMSSRLESSIGSSAYIVVVGSMYLIVNLLFCLIAVLLYLVGVPEALFQDCSGFWNIMFGVFTIDCLQFPDQPRRMMCIPVDIPSKYMPLVFYLLLSLFSGPDVGYALSIGLGWAYVQGHLDRLKPSSYTLEELESSGGILHSISRRRGFVPAGAGIGHDAWIPVNAAAATEANSSGSASSTSASSQSTSTIKSAQQNVFSGSGHTVGGSGGGGYFGSGNAPRLTPEEMAARRLAALQGGGGANV